MGQKQGAQEGPGAILILAGAGHMEQMFTVVDSRYRSRKPMIITTNLTLEEIKNPPDLAHARIYDRILERCAPILFSGKNFRKEQAAVTKAAAREIVSQD